tara:strand:- start:188 stop:361 length:174 start_codon:yes stop_codon:yes gene_type:complete
VHAQTAAAKLAVLPLCNVTAKVSALMLAPMGIPTMSPVMMRQVLVAAVVVDSPSACA